MPLASILKKNIITKEYIWCGPISSSEDSPVDVMLVFEVSY